MRRTYVVEGAIENLEDDDNLVTASSNDLGRWLILYSLTNYFPQIMISMLPGSLPTSSSNSCELFLLFPQEARVQHNDHYLVYS
jgi:hypothetical protein